MINIWEERVSNILSDIGVGYSKKRMMGGLTFMVNEKMCVGVIRNNLMARIALKIYEEALKRKDVSLWISLADL